MNREANEVLSHFNMTKEGTFLKLSKSDVKRKRKLKEMRAVMDAENKVSEPNSADKTSGKQCVVPAKKARTENTVDTANEADKEKAKDEKPTVEDHDEEEEEEEGSEAEQEDDDQDSGEDEDAEGDEDEDEDEEGAADSGDDNEDEDEEENPTDNEDDSGEDDDSD